jgi:sulfur-carrier protein
MKLLYFAWVKDRIGLSEETVSLPEQVTTISELLDWLSSRGENYASAINEGKTVRIAVNQNYAPEDRSITDGDEIALFPPVTGG